VDKEQAVLGVYPWGHLNMAKIEGHGMFKDFPS